VSRWHPGGPGLILASAALLCRVRALALARWRALGDIGAAKCCPIFTIVRSAPPISSHTSSCVLTSPQVPGVVSCEASHGVARLGAWPGRQEGEDRCLGEDRPRCYQGKPSWFRLGPVSAIPMLLLMGRGRPEAVNSGADRCWHV
jgi:hypothetical protein